MQGDPAFDAAGLDIGLGAEHRQPILPVEAGLAAADRSREIIVDRRNRQEAGHGEIASIVGDSAAGVDPDIKPGPAHVDRVVRRDPAGQGPRRAISAGRRSTDGQQQGCGKEQCAHVHDPP